MYFFITKMERCQFVNNRNNKCKRKVTLKNRFEMYLCTQHFNILEKRYNTWIMPKYRQVQLAKNSKINYLFLMFIYRELKKKYIFLSKYIWLSIINDINKMNLSDTFIHCDTGKLLIVIDTKRHQYQHIDVDLCLVEYNDSPDIYRFVWLEYLQMYVPWNDKEPLETRHQISKTYAGHPSYADKNIKNSRYNGVKCNYIPMTPLPYIKYHNIHSII